MDTLRTLSFAFLWALRCTPREQRVNPPGRKAPDGPFQINGKIDARGKILGAVGIGLALAVAPSAPAQQTSNEQITSGSMTVSAADPSGSLSLVADNLTVGGSFNPLGIQFPAAYVVSPGPLVGPVRMSWGSDTISGWSGSMLFNGVTYDLGGSNVSSLILMSAADISVNKAGTYREPFTTSVSLCGVLSSASNVCDASVNLTGAGTVDMVTLAVPNMPGAFEIESATYTFANAPEPGMLALFATGLLGLGLSRRSPSWRSTRLC